MKNKPANINDLDWQLLTKKYDNMEKILPKINAGYPIPYLLGDISFYGYPFKVNENVLIPRFETETLIEKLTILIKKLNLETSNLIDLGTGSGVIAITLKKIIPTLEITAIDKSVKALEVARENALLNGVNICLEEKDIFTYELPKNISIIVSNPPYIEESSNYSPNIMYEPKEAIFVPDNNPLIYYEQILKLAVSKINSKFLIAFEIDEDHKLDMQNLIKRYFPNSKFSIEEDLTGKTRYAFIYSE